MKDKKSTPRRDLIVDDEIDVDDEYLRRQRVDPDERDEYLEWRRERGRRGRKRKDKAGGRHVRRRDDDEF
ncbi:MAG: hypothetical protein OQK55_04760 [Thermoanaerobaculales bacterium]|jgi:hypothetical protein|nr:hypothetical protein [Thermoanaerobaculales bacterium]